MALKSLDERDVKLLALLQRDATTSLAEMAEEVSLSQTPAWRRLQRLLEDGFVRTRVALLDRRKLNVAVTVFVRVRAGRHSANWLEAFKEAIAEIPEVLEAYRMSGDVDYLLKIAVPSIDAYDDVYRRLIELAEFVDVNSGFVMEELKATTEIPLSYV
ncbi:ArsR family transcriptional regulator [Caulobacter sp. CCUG 60055]|uniref:Lrp/AsnC family transcriptional regulator n=1 Tax=Caulobacter sp. CCUG 60055 TaxID=2100090 RepID=UPI001FA6DC9A|nr:Lrp/AsnC family transcriptional regulator [Caulobacter sp. CCUG 60055]MBQ1541354.1 Lrp/AsnC family transcriptional regulator [Caulobacteraceae bacterium]MCI3182027.1 ArsR family transcriptional regulator [Caulobacter sp. CCUG 60055]